MMGKRMKSIWERLAAIVVGLLGFATCGKIENIIESPDMYGEPYADFKVLGSVTGENGDPIEGIRVAVTRHNHYENTPYVIYDQNDWYEYDTLFTDDKGAYLLKTIIFEGPDDVRIVFEDVDGEDHGGTFETVEATPPVRQTNKADHAWYGGAFEAEADVVMKKQ